MNAPQFVLQATGLSIGYGHGKRACALHQHLELAVEPGTVTALLGPNGAGKSTLLRVMAGLQKPLSGQVSVLGNDVHQLPTAQLARLRALVLSSAPGVPGLRAEQAVALGRAPHTGWLGRLSTADEAHVAEAMRRTYSTHLAQRSLHTLSDGERQKVFLARALAQDAPLVLLDEPTAHLDLPSRVALLRLLHTLARQTGKSFIVCGHDLDLLLQVADQVWLLAPGGIFHQGTPETLALSGMLAAGFHTQHQPVMVEAGAVALLAGQPGSPVYVDAHPDLRRWTVQAVRRWGFQPVEDAACSLRITAYYHNNTPIWMLLPQGSDPEKYTSLDALFQQLSQVYFTSKS